MSDLQGQVERVIRTLRDNPQPFFFLSKFGPHLRGIERWIPNMTCVYLRSTDATKHAADYHSEQIFMPSTSPTKAEQTVDPVHWLLRNPEVQRLIAERTPAGTKPLIVVPPHDLMTEQLCAELGYELMVPPVALRHKLDSKLAFTEMGVREGFNPVPHVMAKVHTWADLVRVTDEAGIGQHVVIQTAYGEGGDGTWFIRDEQQFDEKIAEFAGKDVRIMKFIRHHSVELEAVATRDGTIVGPPLREMVGHKEVALFGGSSSGLEYFPEIINDEQRVRLVSIVERIGNIFAEQGFRGLFEVGFIHDIDTDELYLGESNPRFSGSGMVTNSASASIWGIPLYALHLLEYLDHDLQLDPKVWNDSWRTVPSGHEWGNIVIRHIDPHPAVDTRVPRSGTYRLTDAGALEFVKPGNDWFDLEPGEVFYLAFHTPGTVRLQNDTIGLLFERSVFQDDASQFTDHAKDLIRAVHALYETRPMSFFERAWGGVTRRVRAQFDRLRRRRQG